MRRAAVVAGALALAAPAAAAAQVQQVLLPGPTPYPTQSPPLVSGSAPPPAALPFRIHARADERVRVGVDPEGEVVRVSVLHRLALTGTGDYIIVVAAPVEDVRAAAESESQPGLRTGQILWSGFSPGRKVLAADATLRPAAAERFLPLRLRASREGDLYTLTVTNATRVAQIAYEGRAFRRQLAGLLDRTRRQSLRGVKLTSAYASIDGPVRVRKQPARVAAPFRVEGELRFPSAPASVTGGTLRGRSVSFSGVLGDERPLSLRVEMRGGGGAPRVRVVGAPTGLVRALTPPREPTWAAAVRRSRRHTAKALLRRLMDTRMQLVRADQYRAFLANPDPGGTSRTAYVYESALAPRRAAPAAETGSGGGNDGLVLALALGGSVLGVAAALVLWAHS